MPKRPTSRNLGGSSYDGHEFGTSWWMERALSKPHRRAYEAVALTIRMRLKKPPKRILDYACGPGLLVRSLVEHFPDTDIIAWDESAEAIDAVPQVLSDAGLDSFAERVCAERRLLPDLDAEELKADVAVFCFPDFRGAEEGPVIKRLKKRFPDDWAFVQELFGHISEVAPDAARTPNDLLVLRLAHREMRRHVKKRGLILRVDYGHAGRFGCEDGWQDCMAALEGSEDLGIRVRKPKEPLVFTKLEDATWHPSPVIRDVHAQTGDKEDLKGGFFINILRAK